MRPCYSNPLVPPGTAVHARTGYSANLIKRPANIIIGSKVIEKGSKHMKTQPTRQAGVARDRPRAGRKTIALLAGLVLAAEVAVPLRAEVIDDMSGPDEKYTHYPWDHPLDVGLREGQLVLEGQFPVPPRVDGGSPTTFNSVGWGDLREVDLNGRRLELRIDLVSVNTNEVFLFFGTNGEEGYWVSLDEDEIGLVKFQPRAALFWEKAPVKNKNMTLVLALTGRGNTMEITVKVLDKDAAGRVLYERTIVDGPRVDTPVPVLRPKGMTFWSAESGPPRTKFTLNPWVGLWHGWFQPEPPPIELVLDNLEYDLYEVPKPYVQTPTISPPSVSLGAMVTLTARASSTLPVSYQWQLNGKDIAGATNRQYVLKNAQLSDAGPYTVVVRNAGAEVVSAPVTLDVDLAFTKITEGAIVNEVALGAGAAWADFDNDGYLDLFVATGSGNTAQADSLYRNNRDGTFTKITEGLLVTETNVSVLAAWGDYDNDDLTDLFVSGSVGVGQSFVYRNKGDGAFERMNRAGIGVSLGNCAGAWGDYDQDGFLDLFAGGFGQTSRLYRNKGDGTFGEVTNGPLAARLGSPYGPIWGDYDNDGRQDLFVAHYTGTNFLFRNLGGGNFARIQEGPVVTDPGYPSIGPAWGDYDNDGFLDLFVPNGDWSTDLVYQSFLYHNNHDGTFTKVTEGDIVTDKRPWITGMWEDYDNDGDLDLFVATWGHNNALYRNNGDGTFDSVTTGSLVHDGKSSGYASIGGAWGDYNRDGFADLYVSGHDGNGFLYRNNGNANHWLTVKCVGKVSNRSAIGAKVRVHATIGGKTYWQMREISCGNGWSGNSQDPHFGLGDATNIATLRIEWPSGIVQELQNVAVDRFLTIEEPMRLSLALPTVTMTGDFLCTLKGEVGKTCCVEVSSDLVKWTPLRDVILTQSAEVVTVGPIDAVQAQFYRAVAKKP